MQKFFKTKDKNKISLDLVNKKSEFLMDYKLEFKIDCKTKGIKN